MRIMSANTFMRRPGLVKTKLWGWAWGSSFSNSTVRRSPVWATKRATLKCMLGYIPIFTMRASPVAAAASEASEGSEGSEAAEASVASGVSFSASSESGSPSAGETTGSGSVAAAGAVLTGTAEAFCFFHI